MNPTERSVNWIEETSRSLLGGFPSLRRANSTYLTERLCRTLLERLPPDVGLELMNLLPDNLELKHFDCESLSSAAAQQPDPSIGYPELIETASRSVIEPIQEPEQPDFFERIVDYFLWAFAQEFSPDLKRRISENLPSDIRSRMNLYAGHAEESKVA